MPRRPNPVAAPAGAVATPPAGAPAPTAGPASDARSASRGTCGYTPFSPSGWDTSRWPWIPAAAAARSSCSCCARTRAGSASPWRASRGASPAVTWRAGSVVGSSRTASWTRCASCSVSCASPGRAGGRSCWVGGGRLGRRRRRLWHGRRAPGRGAVHRTRGRVRARAWWPGRRLGGVVPGGGPRRPFHLGRVRGQVLPLLSDDPAGRRVDRAERGPQPRGRERADPRQSLGGLAGGHVRDLRLRRRFDRSAATAAGACFLLSLRSLLGRRHADGGVPSGYRGGVPFRAGWPRGARGVRRNRAALPGAGGGRAWLRGSRLRGPGQRCPWQCGASRRLRRAGKFGREGRRLSGHRRLRPGGAGRGRRPGCLARRGGGCPGGSRGRASRGAGPVVSGAGVGVNRGGGRHGRGGPGRDPRRCRAGRRRHGARNRTGQAGAWLTCPIGPLGGGGRGDGHVRCSPGIRLRLPRAGATGSLGRGGGVAGPGGSGLPGGFLGRAQLGGARPGRSCFAGPGVCRRGPGRRWGTGAGRGGSGGSRAGRPRGRVQGRPCLLHRFGGLGIPVARRGGRSRPGGRGTGRRRSGGLFGGSRPGRRARGTARLRAARLGTVDHGGDSPPGDRVRRRAGRACRDRG